MCEYVNGDGDVIGEDTQLHGSDDATLDEELESLSKDAHARMMRQREAFAVLDEAGLEIEYWGDRTLDELAGEIRALRDTNPLAAALLANDCHEDERAAALAMAGVR